MDQIDIIRFVIPKATLSETLNHLSSLRRQRDFEPEDSVEVADRWSPESERVVASQQTETEQFTPQGSTFNTTQQQERNEQALLDNLFRDMPEEVLAAAKQILEGQIKKNKPARSLRYMASTDQMANMQDPEPCATVLDVIMDSALPLDLQEDDTQDDLAA